MYRILKKMLPCIGDLQSSADSVKEMHTVVLFQFLNGKADRRLRHMQDLRRSRGIKSVFAYFTKYDHVPYRHSKLLVSKCLSFLLNYIISTIKNQAV